MRSRFKNLVDLFTRIPLTQVLRSTAHPLCLFQKGNLGRLRDFRVSDSGRYLYHDVFTETLKEARGKELVANDLAASTQELKNVKNMSHCDSSTCVTRTKICSGYV